MTTLWPCSQCDEPGVRNLGTNGYCAQHLGQLYRTFDASAFGDIGVGLQAGPLRPDYGHGWAHLECLVCDARWVGVIGDTCGWCVDAHTQQLARQSALALTPSDIDVDDTRFGAAMGAWADRLWVAVEAQIVTRWEAETAIRRHRRAAA